jgi:hypothetical protein
LLKRSREKSENSDATTAHGLVGVEDLEDPAHLDRHHARLARRDELGHESKCRVREQRERPARAGYSDRDTQ